MTQPSQPNQSVPGCGKPLTVTGIHNGRSKWSPRGYDQKDVAWLQSLPTLTPTGVILCADCGTAYRAQSHIGVTVSNDLAVEGLHCGTPVKVTESRTNLLGNRHYPNCGANLGKLGVKSFAHISERPVGQWVDGEWQSGPAPKPASTPDWDPEKAAAMWALVQEIRAQHSELKTLLHV